MSKGTDRPLVFGRNGYVTAASLIYLHVEKKRTTRKPGNIYKRRILSYFSFNKIKSLSSAHD